MCRPPSWSGFGTGRTGCIVGWKQKIPVAGDFKTTTLGERPAIITRSAPDESALVVMGGRGVGSVDHMVTEVGIRGMYRYWRKAMGL
jgi:hypothetical protein